VQTPAQPEGGARSWRARLRKLVHELGADEWDEPEAGTSGPDANDTHPGAQASLDELLREASEARHPHKEDGPGT
jgi:hypothetical protein